MQQPTISVETATCAFRETRIRPKRGTWLSTENDRPCGCVVVVFMLWKYPEIREAKDVAHEAFVRANRYFGSDYRAGLELGFDGEQRLHMSGRFLQGYLDGRAIARAMFEEMAIAS